MAAGGVRNLAAESDHFFPPTTFDISRLDDNIAMSAATDKSRFYLEQSVPELKEYERKKIFSKVSPIHLTTTLRQPTDNSFHAGRTHIDHQEALGF